jgi:hypothetical protein
MGKRMGACGAAIVVLLGLLSETRAFYLPGVAPRKYKTGERMRVKVNTLTSDLTPLQFGKLSARRVEDAASVLTGFVRRRLLQHSVL